jgi:Transcription termination factor|tara:strand:- start:191 stop:652 length:462 start_codon:yes stop_codon:yes gene_type:complete
MQNFTKSQTRLAFIQFIFQSEFLKSATPLSIEDFLNYFYNSNISSIDDKKEFRLKFNKNFLIKLSENYQKNLDKKTLIKNLNDKIEISRKFEKWDSLLQSLIFAIISELKITDHKKIKIVFNDYLNISKSLVSVKETNLINAIVQKYLLEYEK